MVSNWLSARTERMDVKQTTITKRKMENIWQSAHSGRKITNTQNNNRVVQRKGQITDSREVGILARVPLHFRTSLLLSARAVPCRPVANVSGGMRRTAWGRGGEVGGRPLCLPPEHEHIPVTCLAPLLAMMASSGPWKGAAQPSWRGSGSIESIRADKSKPFDRRVLWPLQNPNKHVWMSASQLYLTRWSI